MTPTALGGHIVLFTDGNSLQLPSKKPTISSLNMTPSCSLTVHEVINVKTKVGCHTESNHKECFDF